jgi:hypothetical protein
MGEVATLERWLDKHGISEHFACSERWILSRLEESKDKAGNPVPPMPCSMIAGKLKFKVSLVEPWLEEHGFIERRNEAA